MRPAVRLDSVSKSFRRNGFDSLRDLLPAFLTRGAPDGERFFALKDLSFEVSPGESFAVIGSNGAGKSTVLKLLAGILQPTSGAIEVRGRQCSLIEVGAGFHPDLTGRENVFLNASILGMSIAETRRKFDSIIDFSGIEEFIDMPVKRYSSGMHARLGFSVAAHVEPDVMIVDEVLSVGDWSFQNKCHEHMRSVLRSGRTVILVSHDMKAVAGLCSRAALLERGSLVAIGETSQVIGRYLQPVEPKVNEGRSVYIRRVRITGGLQPESLSFRSGTAVLVEIDGYANQDTEKVAVTLNVTDERGLEVFNTSSERLGNPPLTLKNGETFCARFELDLHLAPGIYRIGSRLKRYDSNTEYDQQLSGSTIVVHTDRDVRGVVNLYPRCSLVSALSENEAQKQKEACG